jgi:hypothetical protein
MRVNTYFKHPNAWIIEAFSYLREKLNNQNIRVRGVIAINPCKTKKLKFSKHSQSKLFTVLLAYGAMNIG